MLIRRHYNKSTIPGGFTLLELLVVTALIAVLFALLLPALAGARERARSVQCLNQLKQWLTAFKMYEDDNGFIPREGHRRDGTVRMDTWANVRDIANQDVWYNALPPYLKSPPARDFASSLSGARPRFYKTKIYHCPTAKFLPNVGTENDAYFSMVMNSKLIQAPTVAPNYSIRFSAVQDPSSTVAFLETRINRIEPKVDVLQSDVDLGQPSAQASRFAARHGPGGNLAFIDGHVSWVKGVDVVETRQGFTRGYAIFPGSKVTWSPDPLSDPNGPD